MAAQNKHQVLSVLRANHTELSALGVRRYGLFGSFAQDRQQPASDVDLLVELEPEKKTFDNFMQLAFFLEEILERKVDLLTPESLSPHFGPHILREVEYATISA